MGVLTVSGNEITDATRAAAVQGDGLAGDSSHGIWIPSTNLVPNGGFETDVSGYTFHPFGTANGTFTRVNVPRFGGWGGQLYASVGAGGSGDQVFVDVGGDSGAMRLGMVAGQTYTVSAWVYVPSWGPATIGQVFLWFNDRIGAGAYNGTLSNWPPAYDQWFRISLTRTIPVGSTEAFLRLAIGTAAAGNVAFWDGVQVEIGPIATPYIHTNGAAVTRAAPRVSAPAALLGGQGWAAFRFRMEQPSTTTSAQVANPVYLAWATDANNYIRCFYAWDSNVFYVQRVVAGAVVNAPSAAVGAFGPGTMFTVIARWDATGMWISVNGGAFAFTADARPLTPTGVIDFGSINGTSDYVNGELLWAATGVGTLTDTDAANIHANGNTDPVLMPGTAAGSRALPTAVWPAVTSTYNDFAPVGGSRALPYTVKTLVGASRALVYTVIAFVGKSLALPYFNGGYVGRSLALPYVLRALAGKSAALLSTVRQVVGETRMVVTGNEITDLTRAAGVQGDGRLGDSSYGIWEAATNIVTRSDYDGTSRAAQAGWHTGADAANGATSSLALVTDASAPVDAGNVGEWTFNYPTAAGWSYLSIGVGAAVGPFVAGQTYTVSWWMKLQSGASQAMRVQIADDGSTNLVMNPFTFGTPDGTWRRYSVTFTALVNGNTPGVFFTSFVKNLGAAAMRIVGVQVEQKPYATPYVETRGASASRAAARVRAPVAINTTRSWFAFRVRHGRDATGSGFRMPGTLAQNDGQEGFELLYRDASGDWRLRAVHLNASVGDATSAVLSAAVGQLVTVVGYWDSASRTVAISLNGGAFVTLSVAVGNWPTLAQLNFDIGTLLGSNWFDGDILWALAGTGVVSNADAVTLNALGNSDPTIDTLPYTAQTSFVWTADTPVAQLAPTRTRMNYSVFSVLGRSLALIWRVALKSAIPGRESTAPDIYSDGPTDPFGPTQPITFDTSMFVSYVTDWAPTPAEDDFYYARLPFEEAQSVFSIGSPQSSNAGGLNARLGWHGTWTDDERGSFVIVDENGPLAPLVGQRLRLTRRDRVGRLTVYAYCHNRRTMEGDDDLTVPRRLYLSLGVPAEDSIPVMVEVV